MVSYHYTGDSENLCQMIADQERLISQQERLEKQYEKQQKEKLAAYLRSLGINPDEI
jgi:tryptophanyl-tRNA synthetase